MWPQWIIIVLSILNIGLHLGKHGQPRGNFNVWGELIDAGLLFILLYFGGFFKGMIK